MGVSRTPSESEVKWKVRISAAGQKPDPDVVWECLRLPNCAAQTHCCITYSLNQRLFYILYLPATMLDWAGTELQELLQKHGSGDTDLAPQPAASRPMCLGAPLLLARSWAGGSRSQFPRPVPSPGLLWQVSAKWKPQQCSKKDKFRPPPKTETCKCLSHSSW